MEEKNRKIQKFSKIMYVIIKINRIAMLVYLCIGLTSIIWMAVTGKSDSSISLSEHFNIIAPVSALWTSEYTVPDNIPALGSVVTYTMSAGIIMVVILWYMEILFKKMKNSYTPFEMENAYTVRKIAIWMIVYSIVPSVAGSGIGESLGKMYGSSGIFSSYSDSSILFVALVFLCIAEIFKYGCEIQQQVDETL